MTRHTLDHEMESLDNKCQAIVQPEQMGIEGLKTCVTALEEYANKVRTHEKESFAAHGKYRRAFIQTYALLKSVLGPNNQLHRFRQTFIRNHTNAGNYLKSELSKVKTSIDEIGARWQEPDSDVAQALAAPAVVTPSRPSSGGISVASEDSDTQADLASSDMAAADAEAADAQTQPMDVAAADAVDAAATDDSPSADAVDAAATVDADAVDAEDADDLPSSFLEAAADGHLKRSK